MNKERVKDAVILLLCVATFSDSAFFNNALGLPLDLVLDAIILLDFSWKVSPWSTTYWKTTNYHVLFDVAMILLIIAYSIVEIQYRTSYEEVDDVEATLLLLRFGTRLLYTSRRTCSQEICSKRHVRVASEDYSIAPMHDDGAVWELIKEAHPRICRALQVEDPVVLHRSGHDFSFENLLLHSAGATTEAPCILWLRGANRALGFYRDKPWNGRPCDAAPSLRVVTVQNNQYDFLPSPSISFVKCNAGKLSIATDRFSFVFQDSLRVCAEVDTEVNTEHTRTFHTMSDVDLVSYRKVRPMHLTPV